MASRLPLFGPLYLLPIVLVLVGVRLVAGSPWYESAPLGHPVYGVDFSCRQAEWLGEDCHAAFTALLGQLGVRYLRLSAYWDELEPAPGVYDFSSLDWQLAEASQYGARVTLSVGMKAQRAPEYYLPAWLTAGIKIPAGSSPAANPRIAAATLDFVHAIVAHEASQPAIEVWQVENEPYVHFWRTAHDWSLPEVFVAREAAIIRATDPQQRPLLITHASWLRTDTTWKQILKTADIVGEAVYTKRQRGPIAGIYLWPFKLGPLTPNLPGQAQAAERQGKALWISELQAEPFEAPWVNLRSSKGCNFPSISPSLLQQNLRLADRSGAQRVYLWGSEWWYYCLTVHHDAGLWRVAAQALATDGSSALR